MNASVKSMLIISAKQAVGAVVGNSALLAMLPHTFNFHDVTGMIAVVKATVGFILASEAKVWVPKLLQWVNSPTVGA